MLVVSLKLEKVFHSHDERSSFVLQTTNRTLKIHLFDDSSIETKKFLIESMTISKTIRKNTFFV